MLLQGDWKSTSFQGGEDVKFRRPDASMTLSCHLAGMEP